MRRSAVRAGDLEFRLRFWVIGGLIFLGSRVSPRPPLLFSLEARLGQAAAAAICLAVFLAAAWIRTWAAAYLDPEVIYSKDVHAEALVADGPYRHVRNPLYLGTVLLAAGFGLLFSPLGFAVVVLGMVIITLRLILREEADLTQSQGSSYQAYLRAVPRLLFSPAPRVPRGTRSPNWPKAFRGEILFWLFLADLILFFALDHHIAVGRRVHLLEAGIGVAIVLHLIVQPRRRAA